MPSIYNIYDYLFSDSKDGFDYSPFKNILETVPRNCKRIQETDIDMTSPVVQSVKRFCENNIIKDNEYDTKFHRFAISLSGGVDSMVLATIVKLLGHHVVALHINYNNREETKSEQIFLEKWCHFNNIRLYIREITDIKRANSKRSDYETVTKEIRFSFYKEVLEKEALDYILLGHHRDDIVENVFANVCRARNILDLAVIQETSEIERVKICRPLIDHYKDVIIRFATETDTPYFKDTTPEWSVRGKYRNTIAPAIADTFTNNVKDNLVHFARQSDEWNMLVEAEILKPFLDAVEWNPYSVKFNIERWLYHPHCFWMQVFMRIFYRYRTNCPSRRSIQNFMNNLELESCLNIAITNNTRCKLKNNWITIEFIELFNKYNPKM